MDKLINLSLENYLENAKTKEPYPGGGSVAAYVGAVGTALSIMVLNLSYDKKSYKEVDESIKTKLEDLKASFDKDIELLKKYVDEDASSFGGVLDALKLPKETEEEKKIRSEKIQDGYKYALEVPLGTARTLNNILNNLDLFVKYGTVSAITDVGCSILFVSSAIEAALFNVTINLKSLKDEDFRSKVEKETHDLIENAHRLRDKYLEETYNRLK